MEAILLPIILSALALCCADVEIRPILWAWVGVYLLDATVGALWFSGYPLHFVYSAINAKAVVSMTLLLLQSYVHKALLIMLLGYVDLFFNGYELFIQFPDWFYPHLQTISWWVIELQLLVLIYNIKFKAPTKR
jgi:hypothetical protein